LGDFEESVEKPRSRGCGLHRLVIVSHFHGPPQVVRFGQPATSSSSTLRL